MKCKPISFRLACPKLDSGTPEGAGGSASDANVQELSCFCCQQGYKPQIRLMNRVVGREPGGSTSIHYNSYTTTQALPEPGGSQISSLHSKHCTFQEVSRGHPALCYFLSLSLTLSLVAFHFCSFLSLPAHTIPVLSSFLHPPLPIPKSLHFTLCSHLFGYSQHRVPKIHQAERLRHSPLLP